MKATMTIEQYYRAACSLALAEVERRARRILKANRSIHEFVMSMGLYKFKDKHGNDIEDRRTRPVDDFIAEWDDYLKLTGESLRFTAHGPRETKW